MRFAIVVLATLVAAGLSGCFTAPGSTIQEDDTPFSISRQVRVHVDETNIDRVKDIANDPSLIADYRYEFLDPVLVIRSGVERDPTTLTFTYTDRLGATLTRPLNLLTGDPFLNPGDTVVVPVHMFSGGVLKDAQGNVLADRTLETPEWWKVGGYPTGVHMAPGAELTYGLKGDARQTFELTGLKPKEHDYLLEVARADLAMNHEATITLVNGRASETITATERHQAHPLAIDVRGSLRVPSEVSFTARNITSGQPIEAGVQVLPTTGVAYAFDGDLWWNLSNEPVRFDLTKATMKPDVDVVAWLTGAPEFEEHFSCAGKPRSAQCQPDELEDERFREEQSFGPEEMPLDGWTSYVDPAIVRDLEAFLADGLRPGDHIAYSIKLTGQDLPGYESGKGMPELIQIEALTRVLGAETVTVAAGTFETYKVDQTLAMKIVTGESRSADGTVFKALTIDEKLVEGSTWIDQERYIPVKSVTSAPFKLGKILDDVMDAIDAQLWMDAPIERLTSDNVKLTTTATQSLELQKLSGDARFAPWILIGGTPLFFLAQEGLPAYLLQESESVDASEESWDW